MEDKDVEQIMPLIDELNTSLEDAVKKMDGINDKMSSLIVAMKKGELSFDDALNQLIVALDEVEKDEE